MNAPIGFGGKAQRNVSRRLHFAALGKASAATSRGPTRCHLESSTGYVIDVGISGDIYI